MEFRIAKLAGVPDTVIDRAKELVEELVSADITATVKNISPENRKPKAKPVVHYDESGIWSRFLLSIPSKMMMCWRN